MTKTRLCIIIPAYNEEKRIGKTLEEYCKFFSDKNSVILVVLNACTDNTIGIVKGFEKKYRLLKHIEFKRGGKGFAIMQGFANALTQDCDLIGFVDADLSTPPSSFYDLSRNISGADGIIASRWLAESKILTKQPPLRIFAGRVFNFLTRVLFLMPYCDTQCGAKIFKRRLIGIVIRKIGTSAWAFDVDLLYQARKAGFKIREWPTIWQDKKESKLKTLKISLQMFSAILRLRMKYSALSFMVRAYDKLLPEKLKFHNLR